MIRICSKCGALLLDDNQGCSFCNYGQELGGEVRAPLSRRSQAVADPDEPEWRLEVSRRLEKYRARRGHLRHDESQSGLPFHEPITAIEVDDADGDPERPRTRASAGKRPTERVEIRIQSELDFTSAQDDHARPQTALVPVATLAERRWAGVIDTLFLGFTYAGFLGLFRSLGGQITFDKTDAVIYLAMGYLFYAFYFSLFVALAGSTPGMQLRGLSVVRLDGSLPETRQLLWRCFGYLLSGATLTLGFLWALWDEDRFTWQDRISQTYVTAAAPLPDADSFDLPAQHTFAHK